MQEHVLWYQQLGMGDVGVVGGKNASLGEMISNLANAGVQVPGGFATTAHAFNLFLEQSGLEARIHVLLDDLDVENIAALGKAGETIRNWIIDTPFLPELENAIRTAFKTLQGEAGDEASFAVRSSATAEDMPDASFAGQQETFLNVKGYDSVMVAIKHVFASLFNDRAISYRVHQGYDHKGVALSAGVQRMVRSDCSASGVMFSIDTESGFEDVVFITSSYGLGEMVVQGAVNPDEFYVHKPTLAKGFPAVVRRNIGSKLTKMIYSDDLEHGKQVEIVDIDAADSRRFSLTDDEIMELAKQAVIIEKHYKRPMDIEWAKDGIDGKLYIVQARPETVRSREDIQVIERFMLKGKAKVVCEGRAIGHKIGAGVAKVLKGVEEMDKIQPGDVLVTDMTDPDWEPIMKKASAIVTNRGGRTCHAAIIARELGIPAVVGCGNATASIENGDKITVSCAEGDTGFIYGDVLDFDVVTSRVDSMPDIPLKVMMNVGNPDRAFDFARLPHSGVGLARLEFIINRMIGVHPKALLDFDNQPDELKEEINDIIVGYASPVEFYIEKLVEGISTIASAFSPEKVIVRMSDFKSNEYFNLVGGFQYEPDEENPMLGFRGASRYIS
ncbi:MAG: pyruvate,water dikinase, partial [Paraglaciecola sp.]